MIATSDFLIPNATIFVELAIFLIVLGVLWAFVVPPLRSVMQERQRNIQGGAEASEEAAAMLAAAHAEAAAVVDAARSDARAKIEAATAEADEERQRMLAGAQAEHDRILAETQASVAASMQEARARLALEVPDLAASVASAALGRELDPARHRALVEEVVATKYRDAASGMAAR